MNSNPENRDKTRFEHESPITLENSESGVSGSARMFNYSDFGIYFEADFLLQPGTEIQIGITNSPFAPETDQLESFRGVVKWRKPLKESSYYYGYGVELLRNASAQKGQKSTNESRKDPRKACSVPLQYETESQLYQGIIENVSRGGIFIKSRNPVDAGECIQLEIPLKQKGKTAKMTGEVIWSDHSGFGVKFIRED